MLCYLHSYTSTILCCCLWAFRCQTIPSRKTCDSLVGLTKSFQHQWKHRLRRKARLSMKQTWFWRYWWQHACVEIMLFWMLFRNFPANWWILCISRYGNGLISKQWVYSVSMLHLLKHLHVFLGDQVLKLGKALASYPVYGLGMRLGRYGNETNWHVAWVWG